MKCFVCGVEIKPENSRHIKYCSDQKGLNLSKEEARFQQLCFLLNKEITKEFLFHEYILLGKSLPDFKKQYGLSYSQTSFLLKFFNISIRNHSESSLSPHRLNKFKKTCFEKFGVENVSQSETIKSKKKDTFLKNYGVDNIWKKRDFIIQRMIDKYGVGSVPNINGNANSWGWKTTSEEKKKRIKKMNLGYSKYWEQLSDEEKTLLIQKRCSSLVKSYKSGLETRVQTILSDLGISFIRQKWISQKSYDFQIVDTKILIEVQGDYWHCNPLIYHSEDIVKFIENATAKDVWEKDKNKKTLAESYGYRIIYLWETDMNKMTNEELSNFILGEFK